MAATCGTSRRFYNPLLNMQPPACIGIILDGNRRWAKAKDLHSLQGHRQGAETLKTVVRAAQELGIKHMAVYAFSTENWGRAREEVTYLMGLIKEGMEKHFTELAQEGVRIRVVGDRARFGEDIRSVFDKVDADTSHNSKITLWLCLSYGSKAEIVDAARKVAAAGGEVTEESLRAHMWSAEMPDPDIIIRTGGEQRLSNFLLWQGAYSELFFVDKLWPDFGKEDLEKVLAEYAVRERRYGK